MSLDDEITRILRYFKRRFEEIEHITLSMLGLSPAQTPPAPDLTSTVQRLRDGILEPLVSVADEGEYITVAISLPGASKDTITIKVYPDSIYVEASLRRETVEKALEGLHWSRFVKMYRGTVRLPVPVDPSSARTMVRNDIIIIKLRKASSIER